ncbi:MAG: erythromycin biosynthesis sensory transduction protein eryC1 [Alphaproteobacteria bacterium]|nr:erythromycin biosynthesis sensory transduction protein eryC1 [Alphaproteobacteria bacterium]
MTPIIPADPKAAYLAHKDEIDAAIARVLEGGRYILGPEVEAFEREFAAFIGVGHGIGVANGTDAVELALRAIGVGPGDAVATVSHTAVATVAAVERIGAAPVLLDIDDHYTLDPAAFEAAAKARKLKAVVVVHLYGQAANLAALAEIALRHGIALIEDCAQAHGATWQGRKLGTFGAVAAFSLYPTKNLGAIGDGGIVTTDDPAIAERLRALREYGWRSRYVSDIPGLNSRLDELQAAILRVKLRHLAADNARRGALAAAYDAALAGTPITAPARRPGAGHVFHLYVVRTKTRDAVQARLKELGILTAIHYPMPVHLQPAYRGRVTIGPTGLTRTEAIVPDILSLPMYPELDDAKRDRVVTALKGFRSAI